MKLTESDFIAYVDALLCLVCGLIVMIADPTIKRSDATDKPICVMAVDIQWEHTLKTDVDLFVRAPHSKVIGYSNKDGPTMNLVRDDTGSNQNGANNDGVNSERVCARSLPDGDYVVNLHMFDDDYEPMPVDVEVQVFKFNPFDATSEKLLQKKVQLVKEGHELTVFRWVMKNGKVVEGTVNDIPTPLRSQ